MIIKTSDELSLYYEVHGDPAENRPSILGDTLGFYPGGLIFHQFFRDYALTFDFTTR